MAPAGQAVIILCNSSGYPNIAPPERAGRWRRSVSFCPRSGFQTSLRRGEPAGGGESSLAAPISLQGCFALEATLLPLGSLRPLLGEHQALALLPGGFGGVLFGVLAGGFL